MGMIEDRNVVARSEGAADALAAAGRVLTLALEAADVTDDRGPSIRTLDFLKRERENYRRDAKVSQDDLDHKMNEGGVVIEFDKHELEALKLIVATLTVADLKERAMDARVSACFCALEKITEA